LAYNQRIITIATYRTPEMAMKGEDNRFNGLVVFDIAYFVVHIKKLLASSPAGMEKNDRPTTGTDNFGIIL
jgi:hypothetical protein